MNALGPVIVPMFAVTCSNLSPSKRIPFPEALLCVMKIVHFHIMGPYWDYTKATIQYMQNPLDQFRHHKDVFSRFHVTQSTK